MDSSWQQGGWYDHTWEMQEIFDLTSVDHITAEVWATLDKISPLSSNPRTTTKIPPSYDGHRQWFIYEDEEVD